jgi:hypothetical protein
MRNIAKGQEPASLTQLRATHHATYENYRDKDSLALAWCPNSAVSAATACNPFGRGKGR